MAPLSRYIQVTFDLEVVFQLDLSFLFPYTYKVLEGKEKKIGRGPYLASIPQLLQSQL